MSSDRIVFVKCVVNSVFKNIPHSLNELKKNGIKSRMIKLGGLINPTNDIDNVKKQYF